MPLRIRLSRGGSKKRPYYSVVVVDGRNPRDGNFIEKIGSYNPLLQSENESRIKLDAERIKYWVSKGAQPSERVQHFMAKLGLGDKPKIHESPKKSAPKAKAQERLKAQADAAEKAKAAAEAPKDEAAA